MTQAEWEKSEPCPKIARAAMLMRKLEERNRYVPFKIYRDGRGPRYSEAQLSTLKMQYTAARDLLLKAAGKVGTKEEREKEKEDVSSAVELLLVLFHLRKPFHLPSETWPPQSDYERMLESLEHPFFIAPSSSQLSEDDIIIWPEFIAEFNRLAAQDQPNAGKTIWNLLSQRTQSLISRLNGAEKISKKDQSTIIKALNKVLKRRDFYHKEDYSTIILSQDVMELLNRKRDSLSTREVRQLNRLLIESVFPSIIKRSLKGDVWDWAQWGKKLINDTKEEKNNPGKAIWKHLSLNTRRLISKTAKGAPLKEEEEESLINALNDVLERRDFFHEEDFIDISLPEKAQRILGSPLFKVGHILYWERFIVKLSEEVIQGVPIPGKTIYELLPDEMQSLVRYSTTRPSKHWKEKEKILPDSIKSLVKLPVESILINAKEKHDFVDALNEILNRRDFYKEQDYSTEDLSETVRTLLARDRNDLSTQEIQKLNRLLIEAAYPDEIIKSEYFTDEREERPLREVFTLNRLLIEAAYPKDIVLHEKRDREIDIISEDIHYPLWWIYQAREITESNRSDQALQELYDEYRPFFDRFVPNFDKSAPHDDKSAKGFILSKEDGISLTRGEVWRELESACWKGIKSYSSDKEKSPEDHIVRNYMAFVKRKITTGRGRGSAHFRIRDIIHWTSFLLDLDMAREIDQPYPEKRIWMLLPQETQTLIGKLCSGVKIKRNHKSKIIKALNDILDTEDFYHADYFKSFHLPEDVERIIERSSSGISLSDIRWQNRRILESIFPREIETKQDLKMIDIDGMAEIPTTSDMPNEEKEYIRHAALLNINLVCKENEKPILANMLEVVLYWIRLLVERFHGINQYWKMIVLL